MSNIVKGLRTFLLSKSAVTDVAGTRVYFGNLPQTPTFPAVVMHLITSESQRHHGNASGLVRSTIQIDCHDDEYQTSENLSEQVRKVTESQTERAWGSETARRAYITGRRDLTEPPVDGSQLHPKIRSLDLAVWHTEALPST